MRDTGIVRRVDDLGRVVIPMELRRSLGIKVKDPLAIFVDGEKVVLARPEKSCAICGSVNDEEYTELRGRLICDGCVNELRQ